jgi:hypothetical protein
MAVTSTVAPVGRTMEPSGITCPTIASVSRGVVSAPCVMSTPRVTSAAAEMTARCRVRAAAEVAAAAATRVTAAAVLRQRRRRAQDYRP